MGLNISETSQGIKLSLEDYIRGLEEMDTVELGPDKKRVLDDKENSKLKHIIGQINWVSTQCRPDIAYDNCVIL